MYTPKSTGDKRYAEVTKSITFTSATDSPIGDDDSIVLPVQTGRISRLRIRAGSASHFKSGQQTAKTAKLVPMKLLCDCETVWEKIDANITVAIEGTIKKQGTNSAKISIADGFTTGLAAWSPDLTGPPDCTNYELMKIWIRASVNHDAGDLQIRISDATDAGTGGDSTDVNVPALTANTWAECSLAFTASAALPDILSIGLDVAVDKGACDIYIDYAVMYTKTAIGVTPSDTTNVGVIESDTGIASSEYFKVGTDNEIFLGTKAIDEAYSLFSTFTRARKDTLAEYHDPYQDLTNLNNGLRIAFYPNSSYNEEEKFFEWIDVNIVEFVTDAAITLNDEYLGLTSDPTVVTDFGVGDLIIIDDTTDEIAMVQTVLGDMATAAYDNIIVVQAPLAAHAITKDVERLLQYDIPIPFSMDSGTTLYIRTNIDEKIVEDLSIVITLLVDA